MPRSEPLPRLGVGKLRYNECLNGRSTGRACFGDGLRAAR